MPAEASKTMTTSRARSIALRDATIESSSAESVVLPLRRIPAVSTKRYSRPPRDRRTSIESRVVPAISDTITRSAPTSAFTSDDFPTFGRPTIAIGSGSVRVSGSRSDGSTVSIASSSSSAPVPWSAETPMTFGKPSEKPSASDSAAAFASHLFQATTTVFPRAWSLRASRSSSGRRPATPSRTKRMRSASATAASARSLVHAAKPPAASRSSPPVSTSVYGRPDGVLAVISSASRVIPGRSCTSALRSRASRLKRADFPTFGRPTMTTRKLVTVSAASPRPSARRSRGRAPATPPLLPLNGFDTASLPRPGAVAHGHEVQAALLGVRLDELHPQAVPEPIDAPRRGAYEAVLDVLVAVEIVLERRDRNEAVHVNVLERDEEAEAHDRRDVRPELLADARRQEDELFPRHGLALGRLGTPLARRAVRRRLVEPARAAGRVLGGGRAADGEPLHERPVNEEVRIAPDRRGEMAVVLRRERVVSAALLGVDGFLLGAQDEIRDEALLGLSRRLVEDGLERGWRDLLLVFGKVVAKRPEHDPQVHETAFVRPVVHAVESRRRNELQMLRDGFVRGQHELLDEPVRLVAHGPDDLDDVSLFAEDHVRVRQVEVEGTATRSLCSEKTRGPMRDAEHSGHVRRENLLRR